MEPFRKEYLTRTFEWVSDSDLQKQFLMRGKPTWEGHKAYFASILKDPAQYIFAIHYEGCHIGNCGLKNISPKKEEGELWMYVGERTKRGKGIGKYAAGLLLHEGFEVIGLKMIYVHVADFNSVAKRMYENLGFLEVPKRNNTKDEWVNRGCNIIRLELKKN